MLPVIGGCNPLAITLHALYSLIFTALQMDNIIKSISKIDPAITENVECSIVKACAPVKIKIEGASLSYGVSLCFVNFENFGYIPSKEENTPASSALT